VLRARKALFAARKGDKATVERAQNDMLTRLDSCAARAPGSNH
jgi:hypothetical protein